MAMHPSPFRNPFRWTQETAVDFKGPQLMAETFMSKPG